jgi:hypothetical protein
MIDDIQAVLAELVVIVSKGDAPGGLAIIAGGRE